LSWRYLIGVLEIFGLCRGDIWLVFWRYLVCALGTFDWSPGDI